MALEDMYCEKVSYRDCSFVALVLVSSVWVLISVLAMKINILIFVRLLSSLITGNETLSSQKTLHSTIHLIKKEVKYRSHPITCQVSS
jgi:hypothetical protein